MRPSLIQFHVPLTLPPVGPCTPLSRPAMSSHLLPLLCAHLCSPYRPSSSRKLPLATLAYRELFCSQDPVALLPLMISSIKHLARASYWECGDKCPQGAQSRWGDECRQRTLNVTSCRGVKYADVQRRSSNSSTKQAG